MLKRFGRRFYSAKYVYSIHLHSVQPWFLHDKPAKVAWKRGSKKHKQGSTATHAPTRNPEALRINEGRLDVEEAFELGVTLYADSNKTKKTGPYGPKELKLVIMEVDDDGSIYSVLGALTISLNDYVGLRDHKIHVPVECDAEIIDAVGQPYFDITIRSWYRQSSGLTSASSGMSSIGWSTPLGSDSDGEHDDMMTTGDSHLDPVKPVDVLDASKTSASLMGAVPEQRTVEATKSVEDVVLNKIDIAQRLPTDEALTINDVTVGAAKSSDEALMSTTDTVKNNVDSEEERAENVDEIENEGLESPPAPLVQQHVIAAAAVATPEGPNFVSLRQKYKRLSTINSEDGDGAVELEGEGREDELSRFLESETKPDEWGGLPDTMLAVTEDFEGEPTTPPKATEAETLRTAAVATMAAVPTPKAEPKKPQVAKPVKPAVAEPRKPEVAKPVKPDVAPVMPVVEKPIKPEVAKPVKPEVAKPVKPEVAKPVKPEVAKPVKPEVAPVKPVVAEPRKTEVAEPRKPEVSKQVNPDVAPVKPAVPAPVKPVMQSDVSTSEVVEIKPEPMAPVPAGTSKAMSKEASKAVPITPPATRTNNERPVEAEPTITKKTTPATPRPSPRDKEMRPRRSRWSCLPGSGLVCCQPALPREP